MWKGLLRESPRSVVDIGDRVSSLKASNLELLSTLYFEFPKEVMCLCSGHFVDTRAKRYKKRLEHTGWGSSIEALPVLTTNCTMRSLKHSRNISLLCSKDASVA